MKVALIHDYIKEYGGAERMLEALHEIWPNAPVFTTVYLPEFLGPHRQRFKDWDIRASFLQHLPFKEKLISPFRLIAPWVFGQFDLRNFDVVIVSATGAYISNSIKIRNPKSEIRNKSVHLCYCHTPPRYLYGYATAREWKKNILSRVLGEIANHFLRLADFKSAQNVDYFIANSKNVAERIEKFYRREATVIYPPVSIHFQKTQNIQRPRKSDKSDDQKVRLYGSSNFQISRPSEFSEYSGEKQGYFLAGGRLARPKHIDLIVGTFAKLNLPIKVFGRGFAGYEQEFKSRNSKVKNKSDLVKNTGQESKVEFVGEVSDEKKWELMRNAKAFVFAAEDEDFGITPVEAMMCGTPVIAYKSGGVLESVIDAKTGVFFDELKVGSLTMAINRFRTLTFDKDAIIEHAKKFSKERFKKEIEKFVISCAKIH